MTGYDMVGMEGDISHYNHKANKAFVVQWLLLAFCVDHMFYMAGLSVQTPLSVKFLATIYWESEQSLKEILFLWNTPKILEGLFLICVRTIHILCFTVKQCENI